MKATTELKALKYVKFTGEEMRAVSRLTLQQCIQLILSKMVVKVNERNTITPDDIGTNSNRSRFKRISVSKYSIYTELGGSVLIGSNIALLRLYAFLNKQYAFMEL